MPLHNFDPLVAAVDNIESDPSRPNIASNLLAYKQAEVLIGSASRGLGIASRLIDDMEAAEREKDYGWIMDWALTSENGLEPIIRADAFAEASEAIQRERWRWLHYEGVTMEPQPSASVNTWIALGAVAFFALVAVMVAH